MSKLRNALSSMSEFVHAMKKEATVKGHGTDHETNLYQMGRASAFQDIAHFLEHIIAHLPEEKQVLDSCQAEAVDLAQDKPEGSN